MIFILDNVAMTAQCQHAKTAHGVKNSFKRFMHWTFVILKWNPSAMGAFCNRAEIPATMIAVTLLNRFKGDQVSSTPEQLAEFSDRSQSVVIIIY